MKENRKKRQGSNCIGKYEVKKKVKEKMKKSRIQAEERQEGEKKNRMDEGREGGEKGDIVCVEGRGKRDVTSPQGN